MSDFKETNPPKEIEKEYKAPVIHKQDLYSYTAGFHCGVLVTKRVMKKIAKLQSEHLNKVKRMLLDEFDEGNVFDSSWTLAYPCGEQTQVDFIGGDDVKMRVDWATHSAQPIRKELVFVADTMKDAEAMANQYYKELDNKEQ